MTREQLEEKATNIWIANNPNEISSWNNECYEFVKAFVEGYYFAMECVENQAIEELEVENKFGQ
jgi:hypothetical protein